MAEEDTRDPVVRGRRLRRNIMDIDRARIAEYMDAQLRRRTQQSRWEEVSRSGLAGALEDPVQWEVWEQFSVKYDGYRTQDWSWKHRQHARNVRVINNLLGRIVGISDAYPGSQNDGGEARSDF